MYIYIYIHTYINVCIYTCEILPHTGRTSADKSVVKVFLGRRFFVLFCRHTVSAPITAGTHTNGVQ